MAYQGRSNEKKIKNLPDPELSWLSFNLLRPAEKMFVTGCRHLQSRKIELAGIHFKRATRLDDSFMDAWFMHGFVSLLQNNFGRAENAFLKILQEKPYFRGTWILRFMPKLNIRVNLYRDFMFRIMPCTPEIAAVTARMCLIEGKIREAKKIIHQSFMEYEDNMAVRVIWAQTMIMDDSPDEVIDKIDRKITYHAGNTELELLVTWHIGQAYLAMGDFRSGIYHMEGMLHHTKDKNPALIDHFKIETAREYEKKNFYIDTLELLKDVEDKSINYEDDISVGFKINLLVERIKNQRKSGILTDLRFQEDEGFKFRKTANRFLEFRENQ